MTDMNENAVQNLDEFDLSPFLEKIYKKKFFILFFSIAFSFLVLFSSYFIPNKYVSYATLQPVEIKPKCS